MESESFVLGIDLGTSGVRIAVINSSKELIYTSAISYPSGLHLAKDWEFCCEELIKSLPSHISKRLLAISIDGTSGTLIACDKIGNPIEEAFPYYLSCPEQKSSLQELVPKNSLAGSQSSSLARALRLTNKHGPEILLRHQADWISGWFMDHWQWGEEGNNLRLGWSLSKNCWPSSFKKLPWLKALPEIVPSGSVLKYISPRKAKRLNLQENLLIIAGTTDSNAAVLATDAESQHGITVLGSTLVLKRFVVSPVIGAGITNHRIGGRWLCGGASNAGGASLKQFFNTQELKELSRQINPELNSGLNLHPLLSEGERFPTDDPYLKPKLDPRPVSDSLYLHGLLEGLAHIEALGWQRLIEEGAPPPLKLITIGGGARNPQWRRLRERIIGIPIESCTLPPAAGSARIALEGIKKLKGQKPYK